MRTFVVDHDIFFLETNLERNVTSRPACFKKHFKHQNTK